MKTHNIGTVLPFRRKSQCAKLNMLKILLRGRAVQEIIFLHCSAPQKSRALSDGGTRLFTCKGG